MILRVFQNRFGVRDTWWVEVGSHADEQGRVSYFRIIRNGDEDPAWTVTRGDNAQKRLIRALRFIADTIEHHPVSNIVEKEIPLVEKEIPI